MSAARGTRRPHPRRVYKKARKPAKKKGCPLLLLAWVPVVLLVGYAAWWFVVGAGQLLALGLAAAIGGTR